MGLLGMPPPILLGLVEGGAEGLDYPLADIGDVHGFSSIAWGCASKKLLNEVSTVEDTSIDDH
eukprot:5751851-Heterocapsa_arctica.AAC.1